MVESLPAGDRDPRDRFIGAIVGGRYKVLRRLGRGGMGHVYEVEHLQLGRTFALKRLNVELAQDPDLVARFRREAELIGKLRHPNVVQVSDWETLDDGTPCMIMELLTGSDLAVRIGAGGPLDWPQIARIGDQVLSALVAAHRAGIVHRDLKPANIFLTRDDSRREYVKLLDFGVSKVVGRVHANSALKLIGTPEYMSPEQAEARPVGPESDVWAVGVLLFELATGRRPFVADTVPSVLYQICHAPVPSIRALREDAPDAFIEVVERAMSRDPARRVTQAKVLRKLLGSALEEAASVEEVTATNVSLEMAAAVPSPRDSTALTAPRVTLDREEVATPAPPADARPSDRVTRPDRKRPMAPAAITVPQRRAVVPVQVPMTSAVPAAPTELVRQRGGWLAVAAAVAVIAMVVVGGAIALRSTSGATEDAGPPAPVVASAADAGVTIQARESPPDGGVAARLADAGPPTEAFEPSAPDRVTPEPAGTARGDRRGTSRARRRRPAATRPVDVKPVKPVAQPLPLE